MLATLASISASLFAVQFILIINLCENIITDMLRSLLLLFLFPETDYYIFVLITLYLSTGFALSDL